jgi:hypothetical protein
MFELRLVCCFLAMQLTDSVFAMRPRFHVIRWECRESVRANTFDMSTEEESLFSPHDLRWIRCFFSGASKSRTNFKIRMHLIPSHCEEGGQNQTYFSYGTYVSFCFELHTKSEILIVPRLARSIPSQPARMRRMIVRYSQNGASQKL